MIEELGRPLPEIGWEEERRHQFDIVRGILREIDSQDSELDQRMEVFDREMEKIQRHVAEYRAGYERSRQYREGLRLPELEPELEP